METKLRRKLFGFSCNFPSFYFLTKEKFEQFSCFLLKQILISLHKKFLLRKIKRITRDLTQRIISCNLKLSNIGNSEAAVSNVQRVMGENIFLITEKCFQS